MKKILIILCLFMFAQPSFSIPVVETPMLNEKPLEANISLDWFDKTQLQRDENIKNIQGVLFKDVVTKYKKQEFRAKYASYLKNKNFLNDYDEISKGKKEDSERLYCGFYVGKLLISYGIRYKNHMENIYYYDAMGNLRWVDVFCGNYPSFPYWSYQYYKNGEMVAAYYYVSSYDQYVFGMHKEFKGRWFKKNLYNKKARVILTRTNW